tara:strand:- start:4512 stop:4748 length:237 start_codon:yes stop_codon:yes gene_type:complete
MENRRKTMVKIYEKTCHPTGEWKDDGDGYVVYFDTKTDAVGEQNIYCVKELGDAKDTDEAIELINRAIEDVQPFLRYR